MFVLKNRNDPQLMQDSATAEQLLKIFTQRR